MSNILEIAEKDVNEKYSDILAKDAEIKAQQQIRLLNQNEISSSNSLLDSIETKLTNGTITMSDRAQRVVLRNKVKALDEKNDLINANISNLEGEKNALIAEYEASKVRLLEAKERAKEDKKLEQKKSSLEVLEIPESKENKEKENKSNTLIIISSIVGGVILIAVILFFTFRKKGN